MKKDWLTQFLETLIHRTGEWFFVAAVILSQLVAIPGILIGAAAVWLNTDFTPSQLQVVGIIAFLSASLGNLIVLIATWSLTSNARSRLRAWRKGEALKAGTSEELNAWRESTAFSWRYGLIAGIAGMSIGVLPALVYQSRYLGATYDQNLYFLFGSSVAIIAAVMISVTVVEQITAPAREVLTPQRIEDQLSASAGLPIVYKYLILILAILVITTLLIAPVGYRQTVRSINYEIDSRTALIELRTQSLLLSGAAFALGAVLAWMISRTVSQPVQSLIKVFKEVQAGNLSQRAPIIATDEIGDLAAYFNRMIIRLETLQGNLETQVRQRTEQLRATNEVGQIASSILDEQRLAREVINLIVSRFNYYHAALFVLDSSGTWAELREASGAAGQALRKQQFRLQVDGRSMVGQAIRSRQPRIAMDVGLETYRVDNPLLPETRSEIVLPLIVGERVLGALDVQSREVDAFKETDIETLQSMANQVAIALENARLFQETRESLEELRAIHQQYVSSTWLSKKHSAKIEAIAELPGISPSAETTQRLSIPLMLRNQKLGEIILESDEEWSSEEESMVQAVATQVAVSLENARLIEESQQSALRERLAAEITEKIWLSTSVDSILQTAIRELGRSLEASDAIIQINLDDNDEQK